MPFLLQQYQELILTLLTAISCVFSHFLDFPPIL